MEQVPHSVMFETARHRITGTLGMPRTGYQSRLTEFLNSGEREFVAVTEASVELLDGSGQVETFPFLAVARGHIVLATTADESARDLEGI